MKKPARRPQARRGESSARHSLPGPSSSKQSPQDDEWRFADFPTIAEKHGLSVDALSRLAALPDFPVYSRKICPALMRQWLLANMQKLQQIGVE
jgi:hypothetical protein